MTTMAEAMEDFVASAGRNVTRKEITQALNAKYPGEWAPGTYSGHFDGCVVNNPRAYVNHRFSKRFMFRNPDSTFELYSESKHGPRSQWEPNGTPEPDDVEELVETSISLERDIEEHLIHNLDTIEKGLKFKDRQVRIDVGIVDILAEDSAGGRVVIEIKVGEANDKAIGQIAKYLGWYGRKDEKPPRGILIAADFPDPVRYAAMAVNNLTLLAYKVHFSFEQSTI